jgi:Nucleotidyl transferase AbiEii toxin, Type IV TA system
MPSPYLRAYPPETVIAEKFNAMVTLGRANSRMKDSYDVWMLMNTFKIAPARRRRAIVATFACRRTAIPAVVPDGLCEAFAADPAKQRQWDAFARELSGQIPGIAFIVADLRLRLTGFLVPSLNLNPHPDRMRVDGKQIELGQRDAAHLCCCNEGHQTIRRLSLAIGWTPLDRWFETAALIGIAAVVKATGDQPLHISAGNEVLR